MRPKLKEEGSPMESYVGLDVHSKRSVFVIEAEDGRVVARGDIPTTPAGFRQLRRQHKLAAETPVALETGTVAFYAARELARVGVRQARPHPRDPPGVARPRGGRADAVPGLPAGRAPGGVLGPRGQSGRHRLKDAAFPFETLDEFDFRLRPELNRQVVLRYLDERFITQGRSLVLIGPAGLGKTHLAISIGLALLKRGYLVRFTTTHALLTRVLRAGGLDGRAKVLRPYIQSDLLVLDEFGYLPADPEIGPILYEVIATRYEKKATIVTSNKSLTESGRVLHDSALAAALVDRLMHHGAVYYP